MKTTLKLGILAFLTQFFFVGPLRAQDTTATQPDSIVQITAEMEGLSVVAYSDLPFLGTFYEVLPGGTTVPLPTATYDPTLPTYAITDNIFLVDATGGQVAVTPRQYAMLATNGATALVEAESAALANLISRVQVAQSPMTAGRMTMNAISSEDLPSPDGSGSGGGYSPDGLTNSYTAPDYGTNMWILETNLSSGVISGIISNTTAGVRLELQFTFDLTQPWQSADWYVYGSQTTNWTAFSIPAVSSSNLFLRVKSWGVDANGLPIWWEQQYGLTNVAPNALDSVGDGWTIYQKYQMGVDPNTWVTPAAPQGFAVSLHLSGQTASLNWLPSYGAVTGYRVEKTYHAPGAYFSTVSYSSSLGTSCQDSISGNQPDFYNGGVYQVSYRVQTLYQNSLAGAWSRSIPLQQPTVSGGILPGPSGAATLFVSGVPADAALIRLVFEDWYAQTFYDETNFDYTEDIPVSSFANGQYALPAAWMPPATDTNGYTQYNTFVESVDDSGNASAPQPVPVYWVNAPFYDGRAQMKENLIFQLRAAPVEMAFSFYFPTNNYTGGLPDEPSRFYYYPTNYVCAGLFPFTGPAYYTNIDQWNNAYGGNFGGFDIFLPFEENCLFRNFVFSPTDTDSNGNLTTGADNNSWYGYDLDLVPPVTYSFQPNAGVLPDLLSPADSRWILPSQVDGVVNWQTGLIYIYQSAGGDYLLSMSGSYSNWFGLPYTSAEVLWGNTPTWTTLHPGDIWDATQLNNFNPFLETAQPELQTVKYCFYRPVYDWLPGSLLFSPTNDSPQQMVWNSGWTSTNELPFLIVPAGTISQIAGYAKLALLNGAPGVYGYLGQYFDKAYQVDNNGNVTTNTTGYLSPYGFYFPTNAGAAALVTMPDLDTGERGTCMVYSISLQLDKNHDGIMDTSFSEPDATSTNSPMVFWCNNNFDRNVLDGNDGDFYDDDVSDTSQAAGSYYTPNVPTPDCNFVDGAGNRVIPCERDLQDFTRLWVCGITSNLLAVLPTGSTITLSMRGVNGPTPTIDLFAAADKDGSLGYLTNQTTSVVQTIEPYIGRLGPGQSIQLNSGTFNNNWAGNYFIWCGVSNGTGGLTLTITDSHGKVLTQSTSYIQIVDIKQLYERWTVGDDLAQAPTNIATLGTEDLPAGVPAFQYPVPTGTNTPYILYVHGWNMDRYDKDRFAESAFKRLYWQGYQGRFGIFRWPTGNGFAGISTVIAGPTEKDNYDSSEYNAWLSAQGLLNTLTNLNAKYPDRVYMLAHSMGNVVAGEALRMAGPQGLGRVVNTYVASQAAISAHTYDDDTNDVPNYSFNLPPWSFSPKTPNIYGNWFSQNSGIGAGKVINFYNQHDYALQRSVWQLNQLFKPDQAVLEGRLLWYYTYAGNVSDLPPWNNFEKQNDDFNITVNFDIVNVITNRYEVMALAAQSWTTALGATPGVLNITRNVDLRRTSPTQIWPSDSTGNSYSAHFWHSAEFRGDYWQMQGYWGELLGIEAFNLK